MMMMMKHELLETGVLLTQQCRSLLLLLLLLESGCLLRRVGKHAHVGHHFGLGSLRRFHGLAVLTHPPRDRTTTLGGGIHTLNQGQIHTLNAKGFWKINHLRPRRIKIMTKKKASGVNATAENPLYLFSLCFFMYLAAQFPQGRFPSHLVFLCRHLSQLAHSATGVSLFVSVPSDPRFMFV